MATLHAPEVRTYPALEFRDVQQSESGRYLEGRAVPYGQFTDVGWYMEQMVQGVFAKSIREAARGLPLLVWHNNQTFPIGVSESWKDGSDGLDGVWRIDTKDDLANEAARKASEGFMVGMSVGFAPIDDDPNATTIELDADGLMWVTRNEARLLETSLTPTPAYAGAQVQLVRSRMTRENGGRRRSAEIDALRDYLASVKR